MRLKVGDAWIAQESLDQRLDLATVDADRGRVQGARGHRDTAGATDPTASPPARNSKLVALLAEARSTREMVLAALVLSIREIASEQQRCRHRMAKLIRLSWLSPEIATAIIEGRQPRGLTARQLLEGELPMQWEAQEAAAGAR